MAITFDLPPDLEVSLSRKLGDLSTVAKESALVELYRQQALSLTDLARSLGITRLETESVLKRHRVVEDLSTLEEHEAALTALRSGSRP